MPETQQTLGRKINELLHLEGNLSFQTRVHWRVTLSTPMPVNCTAKTLSGDLVCVSLNSAKLRMLWALMLEARVVLPCT